MSTIIIQLAAQFCCRARAKQKICCEPKSPAHTSRTVAYQGGVGSVCLPQVNPASNSTPPPLHRRNHSNDLCHHHPSPPASYWSQAAAGSTVFLTSTKEGATISHLHTSRSLLLLACWCLLSCQDATDIGRLTSELLTTFDYEYMVLES
jgi:hypothetical protein